MFSLKNLARKGLNQFLSHEQMPYTTFLPIPFTTVGERTVALKIIARCSITQTPTGQSKVW